MFNQGSVLSNLRIERLGLELWRLQLLNFVIDNSFKRTFKFLIEQEGYASVLIARWNIGTSLLHTLIKSNNLELVKIALPYCIALLNRSTLKDFYPTPFLNLANLMMCAINHSPTIIFDQLLRPECKAHPDFNLSEMPSYKEATGPDISDWGYRATMKHYLTPSLKAADDIILNDHEAFVESAMRDLRQFMGGPVTVEKMQEEKYDNHLRCLAGNDSRGLGIFTPDIRTLLIRGLTAMCAVDFKAAPVNAGGTIAFFDPENRYKREVVELLNDPSLSPLTYIRLAAAILRENVMSNNRVDSFASALFQTDDFIIILPLQIQRILRVNEQSSQFRRHLVMDIFEHTLVLHKQCIDEKLTDVIRDARAEQTIRVASAASSNPCCIL